MVLSLVAALFALAGRRPARRAPAFAAGLLAAAAIACLPVSAGVAAGVLLALAVARRWRQAGEAVVGLGGGPRADPDLASSRASDATVDHARQPVLGPLPAEHGERAGVLLVEPDCSSGSPSPGRSGCSALLRPAAALMAAGSRSRPSSGSPLPPRSTAADSSSTSIPAWPAYALLVAAIPALVPTLVARLGDRIGGEADAPAARARPP